METCSNEVPCLFSPHFYLITTNTNLQCLMDAQMHWFNFSYFQPSKDLVFNLSCSIFVIRGDGHSLLEDSSQVPRAHLLQKGLDLLGTKYLLSFFQQLQKALHSQNSHYEIYFSATNGWTCFSLCRLFCPFALCFWMVIQSNVNEITQPMLRPQIPVNQ